MTTKYELEFVTPIVLQKGETISINKANEFNLKNISINGEVKHGTLKNLSKELIYTANKEFKGTDFFTYTGTDQNG